MTTANHTTSLQPLAAGFGPSVWAWAVAPSLPVSIKQAWTEQTSMDTHNVGHDLNHHHAQEDGDHLEL